LKDVRKDAPSIAVVKAGSSVPSKTGSPVRFAKSAMRTDCGFGAAAGRADLPRWKTQRPTAARRTAPTTPATAGFSQRRRWIS
jgi:hypothetical protein